MDKYRPQIYTVLLLVLTIGLVLKFAAKDEVPETPSVDTSDSNLEVLQDIDQPEKETSSKELTTTKNHQLTIDEDNDLVPDSIWNEDVKTTLYFSDQRSVKVVFKKYKTEKSIVAPGTHFIESYEKLKEKADSGDANAANDLADNQVKCSAAPRSQSAKDQMLSRLVNEGLAPSFNALRPRPGGIPVDASQHPVIKEMINEYFSYCRDVSDEMISGYENYYREAAIGGNISAANQLLFMKKFSPETFSIIKEGWTNGHIGNGYALSMLLSMGISEEGMGAPDFVTAYAYSLLTNKVWGKAFELNNSPVAANRIVEMEQGLESAMGVYLSPQQRLEAESLAIELLESNRSCCLGTWDQYGTAPSSH